MRMKHQTLVGKEMVTGTCTCNSKCTKTFNNVHKNIQKSSKIFKPSIHNVISTGTNIAKIWLSLYFMDCVRFAWYCGKLYSCHLFFLAQITILSLCAIGSQSSVKWVYVLYIIISNKKSCFIPFHNTKKREIRFTMKHFWWNLKCLEVWWNTALIVCRIFLMQAKAEK